MTPKIKLALSTCKLIAGVVPGVLQIGPTGRSTVLPQVFPHVPAFSFIKGVEEERELLDTWLCVKLSVECAGLANHQRTNQTRMKVPLLKHHVSYISFS